VGKSEVGLTAGFYAGFYGGPLKQGEGGGDGVHWITVSSGMIASYLALEFGRGSKSAKENAKARRTLRTATESAAMSFSDVIETRCR